MKILVKDSDNPYMSLNPVIDFPSRGKNPFLWLFLNYCSCLSLLGSTAAILWTAREFSLGNQDNGTITALAVASITAASSFAVFAISCPRVYGNR